MGFCSVPIKDFSLHATSEAIICFFTEFRKLKLLFNQQQIIVLFTSRTGSGWERGEFGSWSCRDKISESGEYFEFSPSTLFPLYPVSPTLPRSAVCTL